LSCASCRNPGSRESSPIPGPPGPPSGPDGGIPDIPPVERNGADYGVYLGRVFADDPVFAAFDPKKKDIWDITNPQHLNGGVNHFGSPFNFPEEFITVYRLHSLVPDLIEYRELSDPNPIRNKIPVVETFQAKATDAVRSRGLANSRR